VRETNGGAKVRTPKSEGKKGPASAVREIPTVDRKKNGKKKLLFFYIQKRGGEVAVLPTSPPDVLREKAFF